tara:strand:+ start:392 stop:1297 length:906 start_codon:yes stop_codon:yes gene_type:complete
MKNKSPKVSVIIPTFNRGHCIKRCINSVINQTLRNLEVLVIDNYSSDETCDLISGFNDERIKYFLFKNNNIIAKSRNYGLSKANGQYIAFLDSDDFWKSRKLEISIDCLDAGFDIIYHNLIIKNESFRLEHKIRNFSWQLKKPIKQNLILNGSPISTSSVVIRSSLMNKINGFSEELKLVGAEDYDAWIRCSMLSNAFKYINKDLGYYTIGSDNMTNTNRNIKSILHLKQKYLRNMKIIDKSFPLHFKYDLASSYMKKKHYKKSYILSRQILFKPLRLEIYLKVIYIYIYSLICFNRSYFS